MNKNSETSPYVLVKGHHANLFSLVLARSYCNYFQTLKSLQILADILSDGKLLLEPGLSHIFSNSIESVIKKKKH